jgi:oligopeptide transport system permease protein
MAENILPQQKLFDKDSTIDQSMFVRATEAEKQQVEIMRESVSYWKDALRRLLANKVATISFAVLVIITLFAVFGPMFSRYGYAQILMGQGDLNPSFTHWFGTDDLGRDLFVRCMIGSRISLSIGIICAFMVVIIGVIVGAISGYLGGTVDMVLMRIVDIFYSIPSILIVIILQVIFTGSHTANTYTSNIFNTYSNLIMIYFVLAFLYWMDIARLVRGQILSLKHNEYVQAAQVLGASNGRIIKKHLIPNTIGTILVSVTYIIPQAIAFEAFLSFIGLGVSAPLASLGSLAQSGLNDIAVFTYIELFPALLIFIIIMACNLFGDGVRDAFDPRLKNKS